jgi:Uncharacterized protein conserved in bacteria
MARGSFGERLKRERELREVTLEEITSATRIGPRFLEALENEEWEKLPGGIFNRGFVRSVARYLGLNEEVLLGEYDLAHGAQLQSVAERQESNRIPAVPRWFPLVILLGILVVLAGLIRGASTPGDDIPRITPQNSPLRFPSKQRTPKHHPSCRRLFQRGVAGIERANNVVAGPGASFGTIIPGRKDLKQASCGNSQP